LGNQLQPISFGMSFAYLRVFDPNNIIQHYNQTVSTKDNHEIDVSYWQVFLQVTCQIGYRSMRSAGRMLRLPLFGPTFHLDNLSL